MHVLRLCQLRAKTSLSRGCSLPDIVEVKTRDLLKLQRDPLENGEIDIPGLRQLLVVSRACVRLAEFASITQIAHVRLQDFTWQEGLLA